MTDTTPLPCPFCGGEAELESESCGWRVACTNVECFTQGPWPTDCTEAEALTAWNTRANADARLVEALREAEWTMRLAHERMAKFAKADVGIHGGACPKYGEQELRNGLAKARAALSEVSHG